uniref:Nucleotide-diphospho-sugar transferase domain-containing protein n=1 Tax=Meloidogyne javanica TaxID=6303 RepID=A0A915LWJ2_MELJA
MAQRWPNLRILEININSLHFPFNYGDGPYHLFTVFRANLASLISSLGKTFWMVQQDTYWKENLLKLDLENINESADIIFDRSSPAEGNNLIAGGYFFVRPTLRSTQFFAKLATNLLNSYTPDNGLMTKCNPSLIQFDGDADSGGKLGKMRLEGYYFLLDDGKTCNFEGIKEIEGGIRQNTVSKETRGFYSSFSQQQFTFYLVSC